MGTSSKAVQAAERNIAPMKQLNFEGNLTTRWRESKHQFRTQFWDEIQQQIRGQVKNMIESVVQSEFNSRIGAKPYERSGTRKSKRCGSYTRSLQTPLGRIKDLKIPRARNLDVRFSLFDRWQQVEDSVLESMLQAYLLGRSSACAQKIIQAFNHTRFSRGFLQRLTHRFEDDLQAWLNRPITQNWPYVFIDGMVVEVKELYLQRWCVLWVLGMNEKHESEVLGFLLLKSESQEGCERILRDLLRRGMKPPKLIISDDSKAIANAAAMVFPHTPQQGCTFHKVKAASAHLKNKKHRTRFSRQAADVYLKATGRKSILKRLQRFKNRWRDTEPEALRSFLSGFERTMTYLSFPNNHWRGIHTNNLCESFISQIRRWTRRYGYFQGRGNLYVALFSYFCHKNNKLVSTEIPLHKFQKDTILIA